MDSEKYNNNAEQEINAVLTGSWLAYWAVRDYRNGMALCHELQSLIDAYTGGTGKGSNLIIATRELLEKYDNPGD